MYLSPLRSYVEAIGGKLELTVKLPGRSALRLRGLGDVAVSDKGRRTVARRRKEAELCAWGRGLARQ